MRFLALPAELRNQVYGLIAISDVATFSAYAGLYMSCHRIKSEIDAEAPKVLETYLDSITKRTPGVEITALTPFTSLSLLLTLDAALYTDNKKARFQHA